MKSRLFVWAFIGTLLIGIGLALTPRTARGAGEYSSAVGQPFHLAVNVQLTNIYTASQAFDLQNFNGAGLTFYTGTQGHNPATNSVKYQWSNNNSNWFDEPVLVAGTVAGGEAPYVAVSRVVQMGISNANSYVYGERINRLSGRYFRVAQKSDPVACTAKVSVIILPFNN